MEPAMTEFGGNRVKRPGSSFLLPPSSLLLFLLAAATICHAQVPVVLILKKGGASEAVLVGKTDTGVRLQAKGAAAGEYQLTFDQITEFRFVFPETVAQAQEALQQGQFDRAAALLKPVAAPLLGYLDLPHNNAVPLVMVLADSLRRADKAEEALAYFDRVRVSAKSPDAARATVWAAHCHVALHRADEAWKALQSVPPLKRDNEWFGLQQLVRARVRFAQNDFLAALDEVSLGIAGSRMESESFPESLLLAAQCYERLADTEAVLSALGATRLAQATLPGTNRVAAAAGTNVLSAPLVVTNYPQVAQAIYREIATDFPNTVWARQSRSKLPTQEPQP
jgi:tetratricopeptide (TPR) repeat protein